jgi:hypothetical protein
MYRQIQEAMEPLRSLPEQLDTTRSIQREATAMLEGLGGKDALLPLVEAGRRNAELAQADFEGVLESSRSSADQLAAYGTRAEIVYGIQKVEWQTILERVDTARDEIARQAQPLKAFTPPFEDLALIAARVSALYVPLLRNTSTSYVLTAMAAVHQAINLAPFSDLTTSALRTQLGDWRMVTPSDAWFDVDLRQELYRKVGLDLHLEEIDPEALGIILEVTDVQPSEPPQLALGYARPGFQLELPVDEASEKAAEIYSPFFFLESQLRRFVDDVMTEKVGPDWMRHRVPGDMRARWERRRQEAIDDKGYDGSESLLVYADLGDFPQIICQRNNWTYFKPYFRRPESIQESFKRLSPLRRDIGHCRSFTAVDLVYFRVEIHRLWVAIQRRSGDVDVQADH